MDEIESVYGWDLAVSDGNLIDVTGLARELGYGHEVAVSRAMWDSPFVGRDEGRLRELLGDALLWERQTRDRGDETGGVLRPCPQPDRGVKRYTGLGWRVVREEKGGRLRLTFLRKGEAFDTRCPRPAGGSFYTM